jgi:segregation and condensation protein B
MTPEKLQCLLEAAMMAYGKPMSIEKIESLFDEDKKPSKQEIRQALDAIAAACEQRGVELKEVASGFRFQAKQEYAEWISRLWEEKPPRYSRALLETLALIAYRQPITRSEIEEVRGVSVSSHIIKTLLEREWIRVVGHRDVPGRPALYATTREFLDYFNLKSLEELPTLSEIRDLDQINAELELEEKGAPDEQDADESATVDAVEDSSQDDHSAATAEADVQVDEQEVPQPRDDDKADTEQTQTAAIESVSDATGAAEEGIAGDDHEPRSLTEQLRDAQLSDAELVEEAELTRAEPSRGDVFNDAFEPEAFDAQVGPGLIEDASVDRKEE